MAKKNAVGAKGARLLRKVAAHILAEPLRYEQDCTANMGKPGEEFREGRQYPACGTVACIGGWIEILAFKRSVEDVCEGLRFSAIREALGCTYEQVEDLVQYTFRDGWPKRYLDAYNKAKTPRGKARVAQRRIEYFIKTGE
jgi:hypothetical protein